MNESMSVSICFCAQQYQCLQVVMTANAFVWSYISMPHTPQEHAVAMRVRFICAHVHMSQAFAGTSKLSAKKVPIKHTKT